MTTADEQPVESIETIETFPISVAIGELFDRNLRNIDDRLETGADPAGASWALGQRFSVIEAALINAVRQLEVEIKALREQTGLPASPQGSIEPWPLPAVEG